MPTLHLSSRLAAQLQRALDTLATADVDDLAVLFSLPAREAGTIRRDLRTIHRELKVAAKVPTVPTVALPIPPSILGRRLTDQEQETMGEMVHPGDADAVGFGLIRALVEGTPSRARAALAHAKRAAREIAVSLRRFAQEESGTDL